MIYDQIYMGNNVFHMKKISEYEFVVVFPFDDTKKEFYFSIFQYKNDFISFKEEYKNIPLSFQYEIQGLKFLKINSEFAISFYYFNDEEEEEIQEVYFSYLTTKKCNNFEILTYTNTEKEINFRNYISLDIISPEPDIQKMKIINNDSSILFFNEGEPISSDKFYGFENWNYSSGIKPGIFEVFYTVFSSNYYMNTTCKITFNISENESDENKILEKEIKYKIEELKKNFKENSINNAIYEFNLYKIIFYNTSQTSLDKIFVNENLSYINLLNCEIILKNIYNISKNEVLNIIQVELKRKDTISTQVEYEIYSENFKSLDLSFCKNELIQVNIPYNLQNIKIDNNKNVNIFNDEEINLEEKYELGLKYDYDILNPNSSFYNHLCTPFDSEYSTDLIIEDRKKYYYISQLFCENNCIYSSYNISNKKINCNCLTKSKPIYNILYRNFSYNVLDESFKQKVQNVNFKVIKCLGKGFKNIDKNIFKWIIIIIFLFFLIFSFLSYILENRKNKIKIVKIEIGCELPLQDSSYSDCELAIMPYNLAIQYDKRNYWDMYFGTVKYNHLIWFTFITREYKNNIFLKMNMFLFFILLLFLVNLFLFSDKPFSNFYLKKGKYDFGKVIPISLLTTLICLLINMILRLILSDKKNRTKVFEQINNTSSINETNVEMNISVDKSNKKILIFSIIYLIIIIFLFFYLISFGGIFINSQKYLLIRVLYSLIISFIIPFILCLFYGFLRLLGLTRKIKLIYDLSLIIQNF